MRGGSTRPMGAKRNAPDPCPSAQDRKEAALGPTTRRELAKNAHVCVLIQRAEYPSKTTTQLPGKTSSAGVRLLRPVRLKRKRTVFSGRPPIEPPASSLD